MDGSGLHGAPDMQEKQLRNFQPQKRTRSGRVDRLPEQLRRVDEPAQFVRGKLQDCDPTSREILLISKVLIRGEEQIEAVLRQLEQLSILDALPAHLLSGPTYVRGKVRVQRPRHAFVEKNSHAAKCSRASRDCSSIRRAMERVTVGKHCRNSSSV